MMTTRLYVILIGCASAAAVSSVAVLSICRAHSFQTPHRPPAVDASAVWRPTPADTVTLRPHGDWVSCSGAGEVAHCVLHDAAGEQEFEGSFETLPEHRPIEAAELRPVTSDSLSPWMWSDRLQRMVPVIHLEDGAVLAPRESASELRSYVARIERVTERLGAVPVYAAEAQPRASVPEQPRAAGKADRQ